MNKISYAILLIFGLLLPARAEAWGFFAHRLINRLAVFTLPPDMVGFYKANIDYLTTNATRPDSRRMVVPGEAPRHFLDVDVYGDSAVYKLPRSYADAVARYSEDSLLRHGIVPWQVARMKNQLTAAFQAHDTDRILHLSADLGHYIADACVPLHTTHNYNGQLTGQRGIHALWESRLPELLSSGYDFFTGPAPYLEQPHRCHLGRRNPLLRRRRFGANLRAGAKRAVRRRPQIRFRAARHRHRPHLLPRLRPRLPRSA